MSEAAHADVNDSGLLLEVIDAHTTTYTVLGGTWRGSAVIAAMHPPCSRIRLYSSPQNVRWGIRDSATGATYVSPLLFRRWRSTRPVHEHGCHGDCCSAGVRPSRQSVASPTLQSRPSRGRMRSQQWCKRARADLQPGSTCAVTAYSQGPKQWRPRALNSSSSAPIPSSRTP